MEIVPYIHSRNCAKMRCTNHFFVENAWFPFTSRKKKKYTHTNSWRMRTLWLSHNLGTFKLFFLKYKTSPRLALILFQNFWLEMSSEPDIGDSETDYPPEDCKWNSYNSVCVSFLLFISFIHILFHSESFQSSLKTFLRDNYVSQKTLFRQSFLIFPHFFLEHFCETILSRKKHPPNFLLLNLTLWIFLRDKYVSQKTST